MEFPRGRHPCANPSERQGAWAPPLHTHSPAMTTARLAEPCRSPRQRRRKAPPRNARCAVAPAQPCLYRELQTATGWIAPWNSPEGVIHKRTRPSVRARGPPPSTRTVQASPPPNGRWLRRTPSWTSERLTSRHGDVCTPTIALGTTFARRCSRQLAVERQRRVRGRASASQFAMATFARRPQRWERRLHAGVRVNWRLNAKDAFVDVGASHDRTLGRFKTPVRSRAGALSARGAD